MNPLLHANLVDAHIDEQRRRSTPAARKPTSARGESVVVRVRRRLGQRIIELGLHVTPGSRPDRLRLLQ